MNTGEKIDYIIDRDYNWKKYPIAKQVARIGNSVVPIMAGKLIETQGQQLWHGDVTGYIARKYKIGSDTIGDNDEGKAGSIPE